MHNNLKLAVSSLLLISSCSIHAGMDRFSIVGGLGYSDSNLPSVDDNAVNAADGYNYLATADFSGMHCPGLDTKVSLQHSRTKDTVTANIGGNTTLFRKADFTFLDAAQNIPVYKSAPVDVNVRVGGSLHRIDQEFTTSGATVGNGSDELLGFGGALGLDVDYRLSHSVSLEFLSDFGVSWGQRELLVRGGSAPANVDVLNKDTLSTALYTNSKVNLNVGVTDSVDLVFTVTNFSLFNGDKLKAANAGFPAGRDIFSHYSFNVGAGWKF